METLKSTWQQRVKMFYSTNKLLDRFSFVFSEVDVGASLDVSYSDSGVQLGNDTAAKSQRGRVIILNVLRQECFTQMVPES